ncbi:T9SS type A sorting domain-containing protein [uncultured Algibacter sp.]|uniref:T9SS type A sorting domain-containing protein n=1 Tax=uncultured Algibacter sp. TaxID=298659 RepID=UPI00261D189E|nr:T9SS type A sorting domain-containing protein [uncultured Algibacter sp.]
MKKGLLRRKLRGLCLVLLFTIGGITQVIAQDVIITSVDPVANTVIISNPGVSTVGLSDYQLCLGPGTYVQVGSLAPVSGSIMLEGGASVKLSYVMDEDMDGLSLFSNSNFGSSLPADLIAYVQWGAGNQARVGQAVDAGRWDNADNFVSGNTPYNTMSGGSAASWSACDVNAGAIQIEGTTDTTASICVGEGTDNLIAVEFVDAGVLDGENGIYVITDNATNNILGTPASGTFNLEGAPSGVCDIWYMRYTGDIGLDSATNVSDLSGCFDLSNPISVTRSGVNAGAIQIEGTTDTTASICVGEGTDNLIAVEFVDAGVLDGENGIYVITDNATNNILGTPASGPFNLEGAPSGVCDIWYMRYTGDIGLDSATNVSDLSGCFDLSNPISVTRSGVNAGAIQIEGTTDTTASICVGEGIDDLIAVEFVDVGVLDGENGIYVITDNATNNILGTPASGPFNLEGAPSGVCDIWYVRYTGDIGLDSATNVFDLSGCFDLSNPISVTRFTGTDCNSLSLDSFEANFSFEVYPNPSKNSITINYQGNRNLDLGIQIIDILGKQVLTTQVSSRNNTIDLNRLVSGTYFVRITDKVSGNIATKRVIKN